MESSFLTGDRWRDIEAGHRAGCKTIQIKRVYAEFEPMNPDYQAVSLTQAVEWILAFPKVAHFHQNLLNGEM